MKVAVIYWSATGNTKIMAEAIAEGVNEKGGNAEIFYVSDFEGNIEDYDLVALGCPAMGAEELEEYEVFSKDKAIMCLADYKIARFSNEIFEEMGIKIIDRLDNGAIILQDMKEYKN